MEPARDLFSDTPHLPDVFARWFAGRGWQVREGSYAVQVGHASDRADLSGQAALRGRLIR